MEYRKLGRSGLKVSPICLGTMMFGGETDTATSERIIAKARDLGVNFIDTADAYNKGISEEVVGRAIAAERDWWVLATKLANPMGPGPNQRGLSRKWVMAAASASLRRLGTDFIDVLYLHKEDLETPLEETIATIGELIAAGKIRYFGVSNYRAWRLAEIIRIADNLGVDRPLVSQPYYNALNRMPEVEHLPACAHYGLAVVPYSPLARGVLSGKYEPAKEPPRNSRAARGDASILNRDFRPETFQAVKKIKAHAGKRGMSVLDFAVLWVLNNRIVTSVIAGPRTAGQFKDYLGALRHEFTAEDEALMDSLVAIGHPSTPGFNDPRYPPQGRKPRT